MHTVERIVHADCPAAQIWSRIADYQTAPRWDPRLESVVKLRGDGELGTAYRVLVRYHGLDAQGILGVSRFRREEVLQLQGDVGELHVTETLIVIQGRHQAYVHWRSDMDPGSRAAPTQLDGESLTRLGDQVVSGLSAHLGP